MTDTVTAQTEANRRVIRAVAQTPPTHTSPENAATERALEELLDELR